MPDERKTIYIDESGLQYFLTKLKSALASNSDSSFVVNYSETAKEDLDGFLLNSSVRGLFVKGSGDEGYTELTQDEDRKIWLDISAYALKDEFVPKTTKVNGHALTGDIVVKGEDIPLGAYENPNSDVDPEDKVNVAVKKVDDRLITLDGTAVKEVDMGDYGSVAKDGNKITITMTIVSEADIDSLF